jgi:hypothetical protein
MRTITIKAGGGGGFSEGWNQVTISSAKYGEWEGKKFIDVHFEGYPETLNMRVYAKKGKDGEEFAIGRLFRFANAGITEALESDDGTKVVKLNDSADELKGKGLNIYLYPDGEYKRILGQPAPTVFENSIEKFNDNDVEYWKGRAEKYYNDYIKKEQDHPLTYSANQMFGMPD